MSNLSVFSIWLGKLEKLKTWRKVDFLQNAIYLCQSSSSLSFRWSWGYNISSEDWSCKSWEFWGEKLTMIPVPWSQGCYFQGNLALVMAQSGGSYNINQQYQLQPMLTTTELGTFLHTSGENAGPVGILEISTTPIATSQSQQSLHFYIQHFTNI